MNILHWRPLALLLLLCLSGKFRATAACVPPPSGSLAWWRGDSAADSTGTIGGTFRAAGKSSDGYAGPGFVFGGAYDALALPPTFKFSSQDFTVETWIKRLESGRASLDTEAGQFFGGSANGFTFGLTHQGRLYLSHVGVVTFYSTTSITDTNWHHVAVTREGSNLRFYADGVLATTVACSVAFDLNGPFAIGGLGTPYAGVSYGFLGSIDELAVYGRALNDIEVGSIAAAGSAGKCVVESPGLLCAVPPAGLVGWWRAEGDRKDVLGNGDGSSGGTFTAGAVGQAFSFADTAPGVIVGDSAAFHTQDFSIETWIKRSNASLTSPLGFGAALFAGGNGSYSLVMDNDGALGVSWVGVDKVHGTARISDTQWHHVAVTKGGAEIRFYVDGAAAGVANYDRTFTFGTPFAIGSLSAPIGQNYTFLGAIDELGLYNRALAASEVTTIYSAGAAGKCVTPPENLLLTATAPPTAQPNADFTVTFTVENQGTQAATGVVLATPLPAGFVLVTNTASLGASAGAGGTLVTVLGTLPGGSNATVTVTGHGPVPANLVFHGQVTREGTDASLTDNQRDASVDVLGPCATAPAGLVAWLRAEGDAADELQHTTTPVGSLRYAAGRTGQAFDLDGASEIVIADSPDLNFAAFTAEAWIYPTSVDGDVDIIMNKEVNGFETIAFEFGIKGPFSQNVNSIPTGNLAVFLGGLGGLPSDYSGWADGGTNVPLNKWSHIVVSYGNGVARVYLNGTKARTFNGLTGTLRTVPGPLKIGSRSDAVLQGGFATSRFNGRIDEASLYSRALTDEEVSSNFRAGTPGKCVQPFPVAIVVQPASTTVLAGTGATFGVTATGSRPLSFQWQFKGTNIVGATNAQLVVPAVRKPVAGDYSVTVCNGVGCTNSATATLSVTPAPALVQAVSVSVKSPGTVTVPVNLVGNGDENAVSFSLRFNPQLLTLGDLAPGSGAAGAQVLANTGTAGEGLVGVAIALPAGTTFPEGTNQLLNLTFRSALANVPRATSLQFGDNPSARELVDASAKPLPATWSNGSVVVTPADYEGDVSARPNGDRRLALADWVQVGRFVAGLDEPLTETTEFQRADCAPLLSGGNGLLTVSDWVQAGRFAVSLDAAVPAAGPLVPTPPVVSGTGVVRHGLPERSVRLTGLDFLPGQTGQVAVVLAASGEENALAFSLQFDPKVLRFVGAKLGAGASSATFNLNNKQTAAGRIGLAFALPVPNKFTAGDRELARLQFVPAGSDPGPTGLTFADAPVVREVASPAAEVLPSGWQAAAIAVVTPSLGVNRVETAQGTSIELSWPAALTGASLQSSGDTLSGSWKLVPGLVTVRDGRNVLTVPSGSTAGFFRLSLP